MDIELEILKSGSSDIVGRIVKEHGVVERERTIDGAYCAKKGRP